MNTFKILLQVFTAGAIVLVSQPARASLYSFGGPDTNGTYTSGTISLGQMIPDNSPVGVGYGFNFDATGLTIFSVVLGVNTSGGYNGDMYGYVQHGGILIELFNPSSFSADGAGSSTLDISLASGSYSALNTASAADLAQGGLTYAASGNLNGFNGIDPNGLWTLYFADQSPGDQMTLNSFNLSIATVPEPTAMALGLFGAMFVALARFRWAWRTIERALSNRQTKPQISARLAK